MKCKENHPRGKNEKHAIERPPLGSNCGHHWVATTEIHSVINGVDLGSSVAMVANRDLLNPWSLVLL